MTTNGTSLDDLQRDIFELRENQKTTNDDIEVFFLVSMGTIVLFLQCGFAFLESGVVRSKNTTNILIKNFLDMFITGVSFWIFGYGFAYGDGNAFLGLSKFAGVGVSNRDYAHWFFQYVFASTASTIISGAVSERCDFRSYIVYSFLISGFWYPVVAHWAWHDKGWLKVGTGNYGYVDFAGCGVVHMFGGVSSFVGAAILGPRIGRFDSETGKPIEIKGHSIPLTALGGFILVFGFMAFNGGSQGHITQPGDGDVVAMIVANTVISGSFAALSALIVHRSGIFGTERRWSFIDSLNGSLTGMVSVCAGGDRMFTWSAAILGAMSGMLFFVVRALVVLVKVDDPLDAVAVHFTGGFFGLMMAPFLVRDVGLVFGYSNGLGLAWNLIGAIAITTWAIITSVITFGTLRFIGIFRVSPEMEMKGLDITKHGEAAYPVEGWAEEQYYVGRTTGLGVPPMMAFYHKPVVRNQENNAGITNNAFVLDVPL